MTEQYERIHRTLRGIADAELRRSDKRLARVVEYLCPRCKVELDPDDLECVACGYGGRPLKKVSDD